MSAVSPSRIFTRAILLPSMAGRLGRMKFIALFIFWSYVAILPIFIVGGAELFDVHLHLSHQYPIPEAIQLIAFLIPTFVYSAIGMLSIMTRRLHDMNLRGGWLSAFILLYVAMFQLPSHILDQLPRMILYLPLLILAVIMLLPGNDVANRFGEVTAKVSKWSIFGIFCSAVLLCVAILPLLYYLLMILAMSQMVGHC